MSTMTLAPVTTTTGVTFTNLARAEFRKSIDTRSAKIILGVIALLTGMMVAVVPLVATGPEVGPDGGIAEGLTWWDFATIGLSMPAIFLPILAAMLFTMEWSQKSVLATFTAEPRRGRVLAAKSLAAVVLSVFMWGLGMIAGTISASVFSLAGAEMTWAFEWKLVLGSFLSMLFLAAQGAAFGLLLMNTPLAIVAVLVVPNLLDLMKLGNETIANVYTWIAPNAQHNALTTLVFSDGAWAKVLVATLIWVVGIGVAGWIRQTRAEVS